MVGGFRHKQFSLTQTEMQQVPASELFDTLKALIHNQGAGSHDPSNVFAELGAPSASIVFLDEGKIHATCIGKENHDQNTLFQACSISKTLCGTTTMKLVDQGRVSLSDCVLDQLPTGIQIDLIASSSIDLLKRITVKHLLSHTAGLSTPSSGFPGYPKNSALPTPREIVSGKPPSNTLRTRIQAPPGLEYSYSGGGLMLLQYFLEETTGKSYADLVEEIVFQPLGMLRSKYSLEPNETNIARPYYTGYTPCEEQWHTFSELAAAGLWTTPSDLLKLVRAIQESLLGRKNAFLSTETAREMLTVVKEDMALAWFVQGKHVFGHAGSNDPGYRCLLVGYADLAPSSESLPVEVPAASGICVMTNSAVGEVVIWRIMHAISYLKGWPEIPALQGYSSAKIPLDLGHFGHADRISNWEEWKGHWEEGLSINEAENGLPLASWDGEVWLPLDQAAIPGVRHQGRVSIDLIPLGLEVMLRLMWTAGERSIEVWTGHNGKRRVIHKTG
jgi:CubicO group peptidase (beta-lactamase class C family)